MPYKGMYRSMLRMDAAGIVLQYLSLDPHLPLPFSLAHGVWPYGIKEAQNSTDVEPLHWSFNDSIHNSVLLKKSLLLPHPWLLLARKEFCKNRLIKPIQNKRCLLIGLPPSAVNDELLYASIIRNRIDIDSILVKPRTFNLEASKFFWRDKGIEPLVAGSYSDLYLILSHYDSICCPNFSSVIFFAAAIGLRIRLLRDVPLYGYDGVPEESHGKDWISDQKAGWNKIAALCSSSAQIRDESLVVLGMKYMLPPAELATKIFDNLFKLRSSRFYALRPVAGRTNLQNKIHHFLSRNNLSFPSLYLRGFCQTFSTRILSEINMGPATLDLAFMRFPSIDEYLTGYSVEIISKHSSLSRFKAGNG